MNTVTRTCDECGNRYEIREDIAEDVDYWAEQDGYCCSDCLPNDPYEDGTIDYEDDTDGNYVSWLCETCGDPEYDCGCEDDQIPDLEEAIDRRAERFPDGDDPLMRSKT